MNHFAFLLHHLTHYIVGEDHTINKNHYQTAMYLNKIFSFLLLSFLSKSFKHLKVETYKGHNKKIEPLLSYGNLFYIFNFPTIYKSFFLVTKDMIWWNQKVFLIGKSHKHPYPSPIIIGKRRKPYIGLWYEIRCRIFKNSTLNYISWWDLEGFLNIRFLRV